MLIIDKALYGLRTSGARFHAKFADTLRTLGFTPTYADPDVWIRDGGDCYVSRVRVMRLLSRAV
eukprot:scaffold27829_cov160-Amphora_coffeaeformis.AAC.1